MKTCHNCGRRCISTRKALVLGRMQGVCPECSQKAIRVCCLTTNAKCCHANCNGMASVCVEHARRDVAEALAVPLGPAIAALKAMIRGLAMVQIKDTGAEEYVRGKVEGLESALALCEQAVKS